MTEEEFIPPQFYDGEYCQTEEVSLSPDEYPIPEGEPNVLSEGAWTHIRCATKRTARKFNLDDDNREELYSRLKCAAYAAALTRYDSNRAKGETFIAGVVRHVLHDWRTEQFEKIDNSNEDLNRRILYSETRYGTVGKMLRTVDFDLAKLELTDEERLLLEWYVYANDNLKSIGKHLGHKKHTTLELWASIKSKIRFYYKGKAKSTKAAQR